MEEVKVAATKAVVTVAVMVAVTAAAVVVATEAEATAAAAVVEMAAARVGAPLHCTWQVPPAAWQRCRLRRTLLFLKSCRTRDKRIREDLRSAKLGPTIAPRLANTKTVVVMAQTNRGETGVRSQAMRKRSWVLCQMGQANVEDRKHRSRCVEYSPVRAAATEFKQVSEE